MPFDPNVTFADAERARSAKLDIARGRRVPHLLGMVKELKSSVGFRIFNVGPWPQTINTGSTGTYHVPACPEEKEYVEPTVIAGIYPIPAIVDELIIKNEAEYDRLMDDGWRFVQEVCGVNVRGQSDANSVRHLGIFPSKHETPTAEELYQAKMLLKARCSEIVREIRDVYATDRKLFARMVNPKIHYVAARVLGITDDVWMLDAAPASRVKCGFCGTMNDGEAVKCSKCSEIIDIARYRELKAAQAAALGEAKQAGGLKVGAVKQKAEG